MDHYLQYYNLDKMGCFPNGAEALLTRRMGVFTKLALAKNARGGKVFVIVGLGKKKRYFYLWETFTVEDVQWDGSQYILSGPGSVLLPPQLLSGDDFEAFKKSCAGFIAFRTIDSLPYLKTLQKLADKFDRPQVDAPCEAFCDELLKALPGNADAHYYRATVRSQLGKADAARDDYAKALELQTTFKAQCEAALGTPAPATKPAATSKKSSPVLVNRPAAKRPGNVSEEVWQLIQGRRGEEKFRQALLRAYGGRCAITGYDGEEALEAAQISPDGPADVTNGLLLRADLHTLFDLNLLRVHPKTRKIYLAEQLMRGRYAKLHARQVRPPGSKEERPNLDALTQRWEAGETSRR